MQADLLPRIHLGRDVEQGLASNGAAGLSGTNSSRGAEPIQGLLLQLQREEWHTVVGCLPQAAAGVLDAAKQSVRPAGFEILLSTD